MLSLAVNSLSFNSPALAPRAGRAAVRMQEAAIAPEAMTPPPVPKFSVKDMAGVTEPLGFFDPLGFCEDASEGKIRFYREVELKHGRVAMLAALGFLVGEQFHPLFGGNIDVPAYLAFQQTPLQTFWGWVLFAISIPEIFSVFTFNSPAGGEPWSIRSDHLAGDLGFDPLGLKPTDPKEFLEMQNKELNNGRLAMIGAAGMIAQEFVSGTKLFELKGGETMEAVEKSTAEASTEGEVEAEIEKEPLVPKFNVQDLPGITAPLGFFDPLGFCAE